MPPLITHAPPAERARTAAVLRELEQGRIVAAPVLAAFAHPDDETIGLGLRLASLQRLTIVHLTDGAPQCGEDARRAGLCSRDSYRAARAGELDEALDRLQVRATRRGLGIADQEMTFNLAKAARALAPLLAKAEVVITHAYEGGHPDHDAAAFAVQAACALIRGGGGDAPVRLEFASYHSRDGARVTGAFWPDPERAAVTPRLEPRTLARKEAALACFRSQAEIVEWFDPAAEAYRAAPTYDFTRPPPPGEALYDGWGWALTSRTWREAAARALVDLSAGPPL